MDTWDVIDGITHRIGTIIFEDVLTGIGLLLALVLSVVPRVDLVLQWLLKEALVIVGRI